MTFVLFQKYILAKIFFLFTIDFYYNQMTSILQAKPTKLTKNYRLQWKNMKFSTCTHLMNLKEELSLGKPAFQVSK